MNGIMEIRRQVRLSQWSAMVRELRKESEWLHERDYGNKAAGQVKPMERDGA